MKATIEKSILQGTVTAPPSKSFLHRLLICAALAKGESEITNVSYGEDILASLDAIRHLGACARRTENGIRVTGSGEKEKDMPVFDCRESGSTLRFFIPIALTAYERALFTGSERLMERSVSVYEDALAGNVSFTKSDAGILAEGKLCPGEYVLPGNVSSQYISGLLFALPLLDGDSVLRVTEPVESRAYIDITLEVLKKAKIRVNEVEKNIFRIEGGQKYVPVRETAEGDWSNAAFFIALSGLGHDVDVVVPGDSRLQGDKVCKDYFSAIDRGNAKLDISGCIDLGPVLFAYAAAKGGADFTGTRRLRIKESDRVNDMAAELRKFKAEVITSENEVSIRCKGIERPDVCLSGHNDHRIVMALSVLLTLTGGEIDGAEAVNKSFPDFYDEMRRIGSYVEIG